jgi:hypothetical protein
MPEPTVEILDAQPTARKPSKLRKYGPVIFWGTIVVIPAMNMTASFFDWQTAKLQLETAQLQDATAQLLK